MARQNFLTTWQGQSGERAGICESARRCCPICRHRALPRFPGEGGKRLICMSPNRHPLFGRGAIKSWCGTARRRAAATSASLLALGRERAPDPRRGVALRHGASRRRRGGSASRPVRLPRLAFQSAAAPPAQLRQLAVCASIHRRVQRHRRSHRSATKQIKLHWSLSRVPREGIFSIRLGGQHKTPKRPLSIS